MRTLALDTSGSACSVALLEDGELLEERHERVGRGHAERLIPWIAALPEGGRADRIIVGCGPGSFTGVRIAIAAARGLGLGWSVPVEGVSSLALIATQGAEAPFTVAIEGGHGEIFVQRFMDRRGIALDDLRSCVLADALSSPDALVLGSAAARLVAARGWGEVFEADARAATVVALASGVASLSPVPVYGRGPDARPMA